MSALQIVLRFLAFGVLWIWASDSVLELFTNNPATKASVQSFKGIFFVGISALLIYGLVRRAERTKLHLENLASKENERLAHILSVNPAVTYSLVQTSPGSKEFTVEFVGSNVLGITGYSAEEWTATPGFWSTLVHPDDIAVAMATVQKLFSGTPDAVQEYRIRHRDGSYRWINDRVSLIRNESADLVHLLGAWLDISDRKNAELALRESELRHRELFEINPLPMWVFALDSLRFLAVNKAAQLQYGYSEAEFLQMTLLDLRSEGEKARVLDFLQKHRNEPAQTMDGEWLHRRKDGTEFWAEVNGHPIEYMGQAGRLILIRDLTQSRKSEEQLQLVAQVFQTSREGIFILDAQRHFLSVNDTFTRVTGYTQSEVVGRSLSMLRSGRHEGDFYDRAWQQVMQTGRWEGEVWDRKKTGEIYPEWLVVSAIADADAGPNQRFLGIFTELSEHKAAQERIERMAYYDPLTRLPNRSLLIDRAQVAIAAAAQSHGTLAVMHLNIDRFNHINESFGREAGDQLLVAVSKRLTDHLEADCTLARNNSDDFLILLPKTHPRSVAQSGWNILGCLTQPFRVAGQTVRVTASIGIAEFPDNGSSFQQLTQAAESAVREAKRNGRNTVHFYSQSTQSRIKDQLALERDLRFAVERNQLVLHYQPQVNLVTGRIVGSEALVRWNHPERGLISPAAFIPIAEDSGLIWEIGMWVLLEAMNQNMAWIASGLPAMPVAVNLSVVQFRHADLRDMVRDVLQRTALPAHLLELELTESIAMENTQHTLETISSLKSLGITLSIDDFGTGYSSLSYLKRFAIDKLKIDQSFVAGLTLDRQDEAIVTTVINLASSLGLRTIAEGVETQAQLDYLRNHGCNEFQGYHYSRPVPADQFARLVAAQGSLPA